MSKKKHFVKSSFKIVIGLAIGIIIAELILRRFEYKPVNLAWNCYQPDLKMYLTYKPFSTCPYKRFNEYETVPKINNVGLRSDRNTTWKKPLGVKRILVLGDSLVAAHEVEEIQTFVKLLENRFRESGTFVEVLNGGIRGYSPFFSYFYLKHRVINFELDVVVLVMNTADIADDMRNSRYGKIDAESQEVVSVFPPEFHSPIPKNFPA